MEVPEADLRSSVKGAAALGRSKCEGPLLADRRLTGNSATGTTSRPSTAYAARATRLLFFRVARLALMPDRQNQHDVFGRQPATLRDIGVVAARQGARAVTSTRATNEPVGAEDSCRRVSRPGSRTLRPANEPCPCRAPHAPTRLRRRSGTSPPPWISRRREFDWAVKRMRVDRNS